ncbi:hypothetical protein ACQY0O_003718 [Thecaphora frezii]
MRKFGPIALALSGASLLQAASCEVPYQTPDISSFQPDRDRYVYEDGEYAAQYCTWLGSAFPKLVQGWEIKAETSFGQYYPAGSNPSLELLVQTYPAGIINATVQKLVPDILSDVGPDVDLTRDAAYGKMSPELANHRPLGGLPPFCRYGAVVKTSKLTETLFEVWLPLEVDPRAPLVPFNQSDFPTNSTPIAFDASGKATQLPLNFKKNSKSKRKGAKGAKGAKSAKSAKGASSDDEEDIDGATTKTNTTTNTSEDTDISSAGSGTTIDGSRATTESKDKDPLSASSPKTKDELPSSSGMVKRAGASASAQNDEPIFDGDEVLGKGTGWNGRKAHINNGGQRGFVPLTDLKQILARYRFVISGSNAGHFSTTGGVKSWVVGPQREETITDWAYRSQQVTTALSQQIIDIFYGPTSGVRVPVGKDGKNNNAAAQGSGKGTGSRVRTYLFGVSVGGGSSFGALTKSGPEWDGALIGAPTIRFSDVNFAQLELAKTHRKETVGAALFNATIFGKQFHQAVLEQCDELDGLKDGILTRPSECKLDFEKAIQCGGGGPYSDDEEVCFTELQVANLKKIFSDWQYDEKTFYPGWPIGAEASAKRYKNSAVKAIQWIQLAVQGKLNNDSSFAYSNGSDGGGFTFKDVQQARDLNIGNSNFALTDLSGHFAGEANGGGKILHYHGLADLQINAMPSFAYFDAVVADPANGGEERVRSNYKLYAIPGMDHGRDGKGAAWHFGGPTQNDAGNRPLRYDTKHDVLLALVAWVEKKLEPTYQIGAGYHSNSLVLPVEGKLTDSDLIPTNYEDYNHGVTLTRKHCPYPQSAHYVRGPAKGVNAWKSFECK